MARKLIGYFYLMKDMNHSIRHLVCVMVSLTFADGQTLVFPPYGHSFGIRKATQAKLFIFLPFARFEDPQGLATAKMLSRDDPATENDDDELIVYGVNSGRHQLIYNTSMWSLAVYGREGSGKDQFRHPKGIACDPHGNVYVVDGGNNRIVHLFNPKANAHWVKAFSGKTGNSEGLNAPSQVGLDACGLIYVTDTGNRRIVVFDSDGTLLLSIEPKAPLEFVNGPTTIAIADGMTPWSYFAKERCVFCADSGGKRLWKMDLSGNVQKIVRIHEPFSAQYGAVDFYHNFWVTDTRKHCVLKFDHDLNFITSVGSYGRGDNRFIEPRGIAIWKRYGQTFIAEKEGAQYYWMGTDVTQKDLWHDTRKDEFTMEVALTEYSYVSLFSTRNNDTAFFIKNLFIWPGKRSIPLVNGAHALSSGGSCILRIEPSYSSYTYYHWDYPLIVKER